MQRQTPPGDPFAYQLALGLGWFSLGLGFAEVVAPHAVGRLAGLEPGLRSASALRALGVREIGHGIAILMQPDRAAPVWSRVAGDIIDIAYLGSAYSSRGDNPQRAALAAAALLGVAAVDVLAARRLSQAESGEMPAGGRRNIRIVKSITVNRPIEQVYEFWRTLENLPRFMRHVESIAVIDGRRSRWRAVGPAGLTFEWEAEITAEREHELIAWESLPGSDIEQRGVVRFERAPGARGTEIRVELDYRPPAGTFGRNIARLFGREPEQQIGDDLRRFKQLLETGQITVSDGEGLRTPAQPHAASQPAGFREVQP